MALSDLLHPIDSAKQWADARSEPTAIAPTNDAKQGTRVTDLGWLVLGAVLVGGTFALVWHGISVAYAPKPRWAK